MREATIPRGLRNRIMGHLVWDSLNEILAATPKVNSRVRLGLLYGDRQLLARCRAAGEKLGISKNLASLRREILDSRPGPGFSVSGHTPDVARFLAGDPECMWDSPICDSPARVVKISLNPSVSSAATPYVRGCIAVELCDLFEGLGVRVELSYAYRATMIGQGRVWWHDIPLKSAGEPLDMERVAFMYASQDVLSGLIWEHRGHGYAMPHSDTGGADISLASIPGNSEQLAQHVRELLSTLGIYSQQD